MRRHLSVIGSCCISVVLLNACGGGSDTNPPDHRGGNGNYNSLEDLQGVYEGSISRNGGCSLEDENYIYVSPQGIVTWYDYEGDACGSGENCYTIFDNPPAYTPGEIRESSGELEARLNPIFGDIPEWGEIEFSNAVVYDGISFEAVDPSTGERITIGGNTEQPFGTKVTVPSIEDIQSQLCELENF